jgi:hypothetical protein
LGDLESGLRERGRELGSEVLGNISQCGSPGRSPREVLAVCVDEVDEVKGRRASRPEIQIVSLISFEAELSLGLGPIGQDSTVWRYGRQRDGLIGLGDHQD